MAWRFYPISETETYEIFDFYLETSKPNDDEAEAIRFIDEVLQPEDISLVESVQRGMRTPASNRVVIWWIPKAVDLASMPFIISTAFC